MLALSLMVFSAIMFVTSQLIATSSIQVGVDSTYRGVQKLRDAADFIYVHGNPSRTEVNVYIPPNIESMYLVNNNSIVASIGVGDEYTNIYGVTRGSIYGDLSEVVREGYYLFRVESNEDEIINITLI